MLSTNQLDKIRGSIVGGAVGDTLGYAVEFMSHTRILQEFGEQGITRYALSRNNIARFSDDTQMTLFTAEGLLNALRDEDAKDYKKHITEAYLEWYCTQYGRPGCIDNPKCRLSEVEGLYSARAPGNTCLSALSAIIDGENVNNDSKGCGGIMRVAPIALLAASQGMSLSESTLLGCQAAAITHLNPLGWLPAGLMVYVLHRLILEEEPTKAKFITYVHEGIGVLKSIFSDDTQYESDIKDLQDWSNEAIRFSENTSSDIYNIVRLGGGWVGDECWHIALYCTMRYFDDFESAVVAAVNHSGDSDSTGAVCGNLVGAICGYEAIPQYYKENLEMLPLLVEVADHLESGEKL